MATIAASMLDATLYPEEVSGHLDSRDSQYIVVTDQQQFLNRLGGCLGSGSRGQVMPRIRQLFESDNADVHVDQLEFNDEGCLEGYSVPIVDRDILAGLPLRFGNRIVFFRQYKYPDTAQGRTTVTDHTTTKDAMAEVVRQESSCAVQLENVFIEARDGSDLSRIEDLIVNRDSLGALSTLREVSEHALKNWIDLELGRRGEVLPREREMPLYDIAKGYGLISDSDRVQGQAYRHAGSAATHQDRLQFHTLNAVLYFDWVKDFVNRTIGVHRLDKRDEKGTGFGGNYVAQTSESEFIAALALFDQLTALKRLEDPDPEVVCGEGSYDKDLVMESATALVNHIVHLDEGSVVFSNADQQMISTMNFWRKRIGQGGYTAADASRAAFFAYYVMERSKAIDPSFLEDAPLALRFSVNYATNVKKKGMREYRKDAHDFDRFRNTFDAELALVTDISSSKFRHYLEVMGTSTPRP